MTDHTPSARVGAHLASVVASDGGSERGAAVTSPNVQTYGLPGEDASFKQLLAELEALTVGMDGDVEDLIVDDVEAEAMLEAFERGLKA